jgi:hypothetical protein
MTEELEIKPCKNRYYIDEIGPWAYVSKEECNICDGKNIECDKYEHNGQNAKSLGYGKIDKISE